MTILCLGNTLRRYHDHSRHLVQLFQDPSFPSTHSTGPSQKSFSASLRLSHTVRLTRFCLAFNCYYYPPSAPRVIQPSQSVEPEPSGMTLNHSTTFHASTTTLNFATHCKSSATTLSYSTNYGQWARQHSASSSSTATARYPTRRSYAMTSNYATNIPFSAALFCFHRSRPFV